MTRVRINTFSVSLDGYGAGPNQTVKEPLGVRGEELHEWVVGTQFFQKNFGKGEGTTGIDDKFGERGMENLGAWILGRNMFGPIRGPWPDEKWKGWWGENPPYHVPVFVLTHHPRPPLEMKGNTTFHFVTDGIHAALDRAREAAGDKDIRIGGGVSVLRQYFETKLVDEAHLAFAPIMLGAGESLFAGLDLPSLGYQVVGVVEGEKALHVTLRRS
jgi:dihydrofolate reductase